MKKFLLLILAILSQTLPSLAAVGDTFTYDNIIYEIIDEDAKTCRTKPGEMGYSDYLAGNPNVTGDLVLPSNAVYESNGVAYTLIEIGDHSFQNKCKELTSVTIPSSVTTIGEYAFSMCSGLKRVIFDESSQLEIIGTGAFQQCNALTSMPIPGSVTTIGDWAFFNCNQLPAITLPNSITSIGLRAFYYCESLTSIIIPDSITSIAEYTFCHCSKLVSVTIPNTVTSIGHDAFLNCTVLTSINLPVNITSIESSTFDGCSSLASITIPDKVTSIGDYAFQSCTSLTSIEIPASVTSIGISAFQNCSSLASVTFLSQNPPTTLGNSIFRGTLAVGKPEDPKLYFYVPDVDSYHETLTEDKIGGSHYEIIQFPTFSFGKVATITPGDEVEVALNLDNAVECNGFQAQLSLPTGWSLVNAVKSGRTAEDSFTFTFNESNGKIVLVGTLDPITDESATKEVCKLTLQASESITSGDYTITLKDILLTLGSQEVSAPDATGKVSVVIPVTDISLDKSEATVEVDKTVTLTATITPDNATDKSVKWTSSDATIASVSSEGIVTAVKAGTATITATTSNGLSATCSVTVTIPVTGISLNKEELSLAVGCSETLTPTVSPMMPPIKPSPGPQAMLQLRL